MKIIATSNNSGKWAAAIVDDNNETVLATFKSEARAGCAIREALNTLQSDYGPPATKHLELIVEGW